MLNLRDTIRVGMSALNALKELHDLGYTHRDLKPDNMLLFGQRDE